MQTKLAHYCLSNLGGRVNFGVIKKAREITIIMFNRFDATAFFDL